MPLDLTLISFEVNKEAYTTATNNFIYYNPIDSLGLDTNRIQQSNFSQKYCRKRFSYTIKEYERGRNDRRIKDSYINYVYNKEQVKTGFVNPEFIKRYNLFQKSQLVD